MRRRRLLGALSVAAGVGGYGWYAGRSSDDGGDTAAPASGNGAGTASPASRTRSGAPAPSIGGSLNGRPRRLGDDIALVEESDTEWMHAFLDVRGKLDGDTSPAADPDVETLGRLKRETGVNLVVSLQWDFLGLFGDKASKGVPPAGSDREAALFDYAAALLAAIGEPADVVVFGNEPIWEARNEDVIGSDPSLLAFTRRLKDHLVEHDSTGDPRFLVGSFNRLYDDYVRRKFGPFYRKLFAFARNDDDVDGVDLHVHYDDVAQVREMLSAAREAVPGGTITATEFSPIWRYNRNTEERIASFPGGGRFVDRYGHPADMTVLEYFRAAQDAPRPRDEMAAFQKTMPWYNVDFVGEMAGLLREYGVEVGTFGFLMDTEFRHMELTTDWRPFQINYLFQRGLIDTDDGAHPHYLDDYRDRG